MDSGPGQNGYELLQSRLQEYVRNHSSFRSLPSNMKLSSYFR
jgi:hypothetical protein